MVLDDVRELFFRPDAAMSPAARSVMFLASGKAVWGS